MLSSVRGTQIPVGRSTLGRIMNVIGEPIDECGPIGKFPSARRRLRVASVGVIYDQIVPKSRNELVLTLPRSV